MIGRPSRRETLIAFLVAVVAGGAVILVTSVHPGETLRAFLLNPITNRFYLDRLIDRATLLMLSGLAVVVAFGAGVYNLGGEGQVYAGALACLIVSRLGLAAWIGVPAAIAAAVGAGLAIAAVSGALRAYINVDELLTSFLISGAILPLIDAEVAGPLRDPASNLLATPRVPEGYLLPKLFGLARTHIGLLVTIALVAAAVYLLHRTWVGLRYRAVGTKPSFASYLGLRTDRYIVGVMGISGALLGLAGASTVLGTHGSVLVGSTAGLGWNGIAVALVARLQPAWVIPAAFLIAYIEIGSDAALVLSSFPLEPALLVQGLLFLLITVRIRRRATTQQVAK